MQRASLLLWIWRKWKVPIALLSVNFVLMYSVHTALSIYYFKPKSGWPIRTLESYNKVPTESADCKITTEEFRKGNKTGNPLIDDYGFQGHEQTAGGMGRGVVLGQTDKAQVEKVMEEFKVNTLISDVIPLNRVVPDSRIQGCADLSYPPSLPHASIIIPFHNEWPSILLRTVYSIINRSPRHLLHQIILVDDGSSLENVKQPLDDYIDSKFPKGLITLLRLPQRRGLIAARMEGVAIATGQVLVFFDSHMEVNVDWLQPLLFEISKDKNIVAMATLDYIEPDSFVYKYNDNYLTRYGWSWNMIFFETFFRAEHIGPRLTDPRPGPAMVGAAFAIDRLYFHYLGGYDQSMTVWGGENLEMSWRVWLCGGRLLHVPCSRIGHIARPQPYSFPGGREATTNFNYERAIRVWMGNYSRFVHSISPNMKKMDVGDLSEREAIKSRLKCKEFSWYLHNVWPELNIYDENVQQWGMIKNRAVEFCLDNRNYLFQKEDPAHLKACSNRVDLQGFSFTNSGELRTTLQCLTPIRSEDEGVMVVMLRDCLVAKPATWTYTQGGQLIHDESGLCMDIGRKGPVVNTCNLHSDTQTWTFVRIT